MQRVESLRVLPEIKLQTHEYERNVGAVCRQLRLPLEIMIGQFTVYFSC